MNVNKKRVWNKGIGADRRNRWEVVCVVCDRPVLSLSLIYCWNAVPHRRPRVTLRYPGRFVFGFQEPGALICGAFFFSVGRPGRGQRSPSPWGSSRWRGTWRCLRRRWCGGRLRPWSPRSERRRERCRPAGDNEHHVIQRRCLSNVFWWSGTPVFKCPIVPQGG